MYPILALLVISGFFCHRFMGTLFPFEGDSLHYIYYRLYPHLVEVNYNPHQWYFMSNFPTGKNNPLVVLVTLFLLPFPMDPLLKALLANIGISFLSFFILGLSFYRFFYRIPSTKAGALLGAVLVTFLGFHSVETRQFNCMFALSLACVPWMVEAAFKLQTDRVNAIIIIALATGISLLGGTNVPYFYFVVPMGTYLLFQRNWKSGFFFFVALVLGIGIGSPTWAAGLSGLSVTNRQSISFLGDIPTLTLFDKVISLFLHDHWRVRGWNIAWWNTEETYFFLGAPVLSLLGVGVFQRTKERGLFLLFLLWGLIVTHTAFLPNGIQNAISFFYERQSMRYPNRFFELLLPAVGYFVAVGYSAKKMQLRFGVLGAALLLAFLASLVYPGVWGRMYLEQQMSAKLILAISGTSLIALYVSTRVSKGLSVFFIFLLTVYSSMQFTGSPFNYYMASDAYERVPKEGKEWATALGFSWNYKELYSKAKQYFYEAPPWLAGVDPKKGKIYEPVSSGVYTHFHSPHTGYRFAFTAVKDMASHRLMADLHEIVTPAILGMQNVCTEIIDFKPRSVPCLPEKYLVQEIHRFQSDKEVLSWMKSATLEDFKKGIAVNCQELDCSSASLRNLTFLSVPYHPHWIVEQDGKKLSWIRANHAFIAVKDFNSQRSFTMRVSNQAEKWGWVLSGLILLAFALTKGRPYRLHFFFKNQKVVEAT